MKTVLPPRVIILRMRGVKLGLPVAVAAIVVAIGVSGASGQSVTKRAVVVTDAVDATSNPVDITRASLGRASRDRLKFSIRGAQDFDASDLIAKKGPPGSICLKLWTNSTPPDQVPDYLVCVTSDEDESYRASVLRERANRLPRRVAKATIEDEGNRSITLLFRQASIGKPRKLRFAVESTRSGCARISCIDTAPAPTAAPELVLRKSSGASQ